MWEKGTKRQGGSAEEDGEGGVEWGWGVELDRETKEKRIAERETLRAQLGGTRRKTQHFDAVCVRSVCVHATFPSQ